MRATSLGCPLPVNIIGYLCDDVDERDGYARISLQARDDSLIGERRCSSGMSEVTRLGILWNGLQFGALAVSDGACFCAETSRLRNETHEAATLWTGGVTRAEVK